MWIKWNAFTLLIWFSCFHNLVFVFTSDTFLQFFICFSARPLLPCSANVLASFQSGEGLPSKPPSSRALSGRTELQTGPYCHVIFTFRDKFLVMYHNVSTSFWIAKVAPLRCVHWTYLESLDIVIFHSLHSSCVGQIGLTLLPGFSALAGTADGFHSFHHRMWLSQLCNGPFDTCKRI